MKYKVIRKQNNTDACFVCGMMNDSSAKAFFYECEVDTEKDGKTTKENVLLTIIQPKEMHQSYPNRMHGGVISALLDEAVGRTVQIEHPEIWAVTIDLSVKFRKPAPLDQTLYIDSRITKLDKRTFDGEGKLLLKDGTVCATATARYFITPYEKMFPGEGLNDSNWFNVTEDLPEYIEIGND